MINIERIQINSIENSNLIKFINLPNMPLFKVRTAPYSWGEIENIIQSNQLERFARLEEGTKRYLEFKKTLKVTGQSVFLFLVINQLQWAKPEDIEGLNDEEIIIRPKLDNFQSPEDIKILANDFPYNLESGIVHLCVWTKFKIPPDINSPFGDISEQTRRIIEKYLRKTFCKYVSWDDIQWFKNWESLQSVKSLSHIHVIVRGLEQKDLHALLHTPGETLTAADLDSLDLDN